MCKSRSRKKRQLNSVKDTDFYRLQNFACVGEKWSWKKRSNIDGFIWRCFGYRCKKEVSIRKGTFFEKSKLSLTQLLDMIYYWSFESASYTNLERGCNIVSNSTKADWRMFLREICEEYFLQNPAVIGGEGRTVEIDESMTAKRRKHNVGRIPGQLYVFGGYDPDSKDGFLVPVPSRNASTLLPIIKNFIRPGTTIISDCWRAYNCLDNESYQHLTVNQTMNFVDPATAVAKKHVERLWHETKKNKRECGIHTSTVDSYLSEFMWRQKFGKVAPFKNIVNQITQLYSI